MLTNEQLWSMDSHVHALAPALLVPDLVLVLEMADNLGAAGHRPDEATAVRGRVLLRVRHGVLVLVPLVSLLKQVNKGINANNYKCRVSEASSLRPGLY